MSPLNLIKLHDQLRTPEMQVDFLQKHGILHKSSKCDKCELGKLSRKKICFDLDIVKIALTPPPPPPVFLDTYKELFFRTKKCRKGNFLNVKI